MRTEYFLSVATGHPWSECIPNSNNPCRKNACHNLTFKVNYPVIFKVISDEKGCARIRQPHRSCGSPHADP